MIKKINKIKKLPLVFMDYTWDANLPEFKQFNLIFGWNGSGKTTLSRLLGAISHGGIDGNYDLEYEIEDDGVKYKQGRQFPSSTRVFNQDYIQTNLEIVESRTKSISIFLGAENKELVSKILADRILLGGEDAQGGKVALKSAIVKSLKDKSTERDSKFTEIAKTIGAAIGGNALRDYRKPQAEKEFASLMDKAILSEEELAKFSAAAKQESLPLISLNDVAKSTLVKDGLKVLLGDALKLVENEARTLLATTVESEIIDKLAANRGLSDWVERGINLHENLSSDTCEFCLQVIPPSRIAQLARHFSVADKELKRQIDSLIEFLAAVSSSVNLFQVPDETRFYSELKDGFSQKKGTYEASKQKFLSEISGLVEELKNKKNRTTEQVGLETKLDVKGFLA